MKQFFFLPPEKVCVLFSAPSSLCDWCPPPLYCQKPRNPFYPSPSLSMSDNLPRLAPHKDKVQPHRTLCVHG